MSARPEFPAATPHDPVQALLPDLFWVHGSVELRPGMFLNRNMAVVRRGSELSLISSVRLSDEGRAALDALGTVTNVVRIGNFHGMDDSYYVHEYGARFWCLPGKQARAEPKPAELLSADNLPFDAAVLHVYEGATFPECAIVLAQDGGVLLTADSLQNWVDWSHCSDGMDKMSAQMGFSLDMLVGPPWLAAATPEGGSIEADFRRLLEHDFDHMLGAHGGFQRGGAKARVAAAIDKVYPR